MNLVQGLAALLILSTVDTARILVCQPFSSRSHQNSFVPLMGALARRGHHITYITNYIAADLIAQPNVTQLLLEKPLFHGASSANIFEIILSNQNAFVARVKAGGPMFNYPTMVVNSTFQDPQVLAMLPDGKFDLVLISLGFPSAGYALAWHFKAPFIIISPAPLMPGIATDLGDSEHSEYVPFLLTSYSDRMSLKERFLNTLDMGLIQLYELWHRSAVMNKIHQTLPDCPPLEEIQRNVSLVYTYTHPVMNYPRTLPPQVIEVGAMHCRPANPLPTELEEFASSSEAGFIIFSVGSAIKMSDMPHDLMKSFIQVFSRLPHKVLWQWNGEQPKDLPHNIKTMDWLPQQDLLGHPKCRLFLTHGGLNGLQEAVYHGVPVLGLPMGADQNLNLRKAEKEGYAVLLQWPAISEETLGNAIDRLLNDPAFSESATRASNLLQDQPETPLERAVFWAEYVIRHNGTKHLQLGSRYLNFYQRALIDVYAIMVAIAALPLILFVLCLRKCCCKKRISENVTKKTQ